MDLFNTQPAQKVHNKRTLERSVVAVFIGRGSLYGNPYKIGVHGDRNAVCDLFEKNILPTLDVEPLRGKDLICYCAPLRCHGDSIIAKLKATAQQKAP